MAQATITKFGLQTGTARTIYAIWTWTQTNTENYRVRWLYDMGDGIWFVGNDSTVNDKQSTYTPPDGATRVAFRVVPQAKTIQKNGKDVLAWTANWSTDKVYNLKDLPPSMPGVPDVSIEKYLLVAELDNIDPDINATSIQFQVTKDDSSVFKTSDTTIRSDYRYARYSCYVDAGSTYRVRARACRGKIYSDWSDYSGEVGTIPRTPSKINICRAKSKASVYLQWEASKTATSYDIAYATQEAYFYGSDQVKTVNTGGGNASNGIETQYEITGLESGQQYFFRIRAVNDKGESEWTSIVSTVTGEVPAAPTTWSSTTTVITGEPLKLYWVHNSKDNSKQKYAELELYIDGVKETRTIKNEDFDSDEEEKTSVYELTTAQYTQGTQILWRVRTSGITNEYGEWSVQRTVTIYAPPTVSFRITNYAGNTISVIQTFPFRISGQASPNTGEQYPIGYHIAITANSSYETIDNVGNVKMVSAGEQIYSRHCNTETDEAFAVLLSAGDVDLANNASYTVTVTASMNSGLTAYDTQTFSVAWTEVAYEPNCEIGIDEETFTASIAPYCKNASGVLVSDVTLAVYRREFDGAFTELASGLANYENSFITDPHPALDYARYRIVATSRTTGAVSYYDAPGYPVGGKAVIIQWDEQWSSFDSPEETEFEQPVWAGSMLKLPYNVDVSDNNKADVELVEYIGRSHPISYYGTQLGASSTWNVVIPKDDEETLYGLRRLSRWLGDVYVREPSGSGYWANVSVSFNQKHKDLTIPVTLNVTRVEGGA